MDFLTFVLLVIAIAAGLVALKMALIDAPRHNSEHYIRGIDTEIALLQRTQVVVKEDVIVWVVVRDGQVIVDHLYVKQSAGNALPSQPDTEEVMQQRETWALALKLVQESARKGADTNRIIPATSFTSGDKWSAACAPLKSKGWIVSIKGGRNSKTEVREGTVADLLPMVVAELLKVGGQLPPTSITGGVK